MERFQWEGLCPSDISAGLKPADFRGFFVHCLWASPDDDEPIYIGATTDLLTRLGQHIRGDGNTTQIAFEWVTYTRCQSREQMYYLKNRMIIGIQPILNVSIPGSRTGGEDDYYHLRRGDSGNREVAVVVGDSDLKLVRNKTMFGPWARKASRALWEARLADPARPATP